MDELPYEEQEYIINSGVEIDNELREEGDDEPPSMDEMEDVEGEDEEETGVVDVEEDEGDDEDEEDTTEQDDDNVLNFDNAPLLENVEDEEEDDVLMGDDLAGDIYYGEYEIDQDTVLDPSSLFDIGRNFPARLENLITSGMFSNLSGQFPLRLGMVPPPYRPGGASSADYEPVGTQAPSSSSTSRSDTSRYGAARLFNIDFSGRNLDYGTTVFSSSGLSRSSAASVPAELEQMLTELLKDDSDSSSNILKPKKVSERRSSFGLGLTPNAPRSISPTRSTSPTESDASEASDAEEPILPRPITPQPVQDQPVTPTAATPVTFEPVVTPSNLPSNIVDVSPIPQVDTSQQSTLNIPIIPEVPPSVTGNTDLSTSAATTTTTSDMILLQPTNTTVEQPSVVTLEQMISSLSGLDSLLPRQSAATSSSIDATANTTATSSSDATLPTATPVEQEQATSSNTAPPTSSTTTTTTQEFAIDPQFLAAIPDDIRQEVLATHIASLVDISSTSEETTISQDFLNALPLEIRNEVLQLERELREQQRRRSATRSSPSHTLPTAQETTPSTTGAASATPPPSTTTSSANPPPTQERELSTAEFLMSLPPDLRNEIYLTTDEEVLRQLPPEMAEEAYNVRQLQYQRQSRQRDIRRQQQQETTRSNFLAKAIKKQISQVDKKEEELEPILKEEDISLLLRLLYVPNVKKTILTSVIQQLCTLKQSSNIIVKQLRSMLLYHGSPIEQVPEKVKPLCLQKMFANPKQDGFFQKEETGTVPLPVVSSVLTLLLYLTKNSEVLGIITETDAEYEYNHERENFAKMFSFLTSKTLSKSISTYELYVQLLESCTEYTYKMVQTMKDELTKLSNEVKKAEENSKKEEKTEIPTTETGASSSETMETKSEQEISASKKEEKSSQTEAKEAFTKLSSRMDSLLQYLKRIYNSNVVRDLISVLSNVDFPEKIVKTATSIMNYMSFTSDMKKIILKELAQSAKQEAKVVRDTLGDLLSSREEKSQQFQAPFDANAIEKLKFCRILRSYSIVLKKYKKHEEKSTSAEKLTISEDPDLLSEHSLDFVWESLDKYLASIPSEQEPADTKATPQTATRKKKKSSAIYSALFPFVEAFFSFHAGFIEEKENNEALLSEMVEGSTPTSAKGFGEKSKVESFLERHRDFLNTLARSNPSLLNTTLSTFMKYPKYVDFDNKTFWFRSKLKELQKKVGAYTAKLTIRRAHLMLDSFVQIRQRLPDECKGKLQIKFQGEEGLDVGGLTREWFLLLSKEILNPNYALFIPCADQTTYQPNPSSYINSEHLSYFQFIGRVIAMAILNEQYLDCHFTRSFYKHIIGTPITYHDIESIDPDYYKNLNWMLKNDIEDVLYYTFTQEVDEFGQRKQIELKPNGKNIPVTNENKLEYVRLVTELKMTKSIEQQLNSFLKAFYEIIPRNLIQVFNEQELELLISGLPDIDIQDLKNNTEYVGYTKDSPQIKWFWNIVENSFDSNEKALLIQFVTGTSKVPLGGFSQLMGSGGLQPFSIHKANATSERLPTSHTCFNQLDLPEYDSEELLHERLLLAIREGSEGFGFV
ncbi:hypothetical protein FDP41_002656 [Naegleria fowleri]|uniref:HECT-type E3 ubiquitin transferase n=1 Tax=Naegleria fowleri TaxID=5763 RepID=A0A6A5BUQ1_NAEFO|nr:uncharacterized protein FDP41_002656 [Naegleria fowleri]KAF0978141.1 hypothetical protein FDP41_002656 [Naegleria fowleri]